MQRRPVSQRVARWLPLAELLDDRHRQQRISERIEDLVGLQLDARDRRHPTHIRPGRSRGGNARWRVLQGDGGQVTIPDSLVRGSAP